MNDNVDHSKATTVLILGVLSLLCCQILGPVAWTMGTNYLNTCMIEGVEADSKGKIGRILGILGTLLMAFYLFLACAGVFVQFFVLGANS